MPSTSLSSRPVSVSAVSAEGESRRERRLFAKPAWAFRFERGVARRIAIHPNVLSALKLVVVTPLLLLALRQVDLVPGGAAIVVALFVTFGALDYLDGVVARERGLATRFGSIFDRVTDYPLVFALSAFCLDVVPQPLIAVKLGLDLVLLVLYVLGRGSTQNRLRTTFSYTTLLALLSLSQGWLPVAAGVALVTTLLYGNIVLSLVVALYNLDILKKRYFADLLSLGNLASGAASIFFASRGRFDLCVVCLLLGAGFDGLDGAAARRWGGTRWGVYSDDVADGVSNGLAPGAAILFAVGGVTGAVLGVAFAGLTVVRLVAFTLDKGKSNPNYFKGLPSTAGALIVLCTAALVGGGSTWGVSASAGSVSVAFSAGIAGMSMVGFGTRYRHLGRWLGGGLGRVSHALGKAWGMVTPRKRHARVWLTVVVGGVLCAGAAVVWSQGRLWALIALLALALSYAFSPAARTLFCMRRRTRAVH